MATVQTASLYSEGGGGIGALAPTVAMHAHDSTEMFSKEASNPERCEENHHHGAWTQNPATRPPTVVYRVTSLPLDAYSKAAQRNMQLQDNRDAANSRRKQQQQDDCEGVSGWWGCCWIGWLGVV
jgi:hypothetical protein